MKTEIEVELLKQQVEALDLRIRFLESNWLRWTKDTSETGQKIMVAIEEMVRK